MSVEGLSDLNGLATVVFNDNDTFTLTVKSKDITEKSAGKYKINIILEDDASTEKSEYTISIKLGFVPHEEPKSEDVSSSSNSTGNETTEESSCD